MRQKYISFPVFAVSTLSLLAVSACHRPERVAATSSRDAALTCPQIQMEKRRAEQAKLAAREHDRFEFRYILLVPAAVSLYNFHKAEQAADARMEQLDTLYTQKDCANYREPPAAATPSQGGYPSMTPGMGMPSQGGGMMPPPAPFNPDDVAPDPFGQQPQSGRPAY